WRNRVKLHKRVLECQSAYVEFDSMFLAIEQKYKLTASEMFMILADNMRRLAGSCVRSERDCDKGLTAN
ncbi:hypothetical protein, partial [Staphylococcus aureus]|uniref:hypothetical protein n=1 Tax=Staphylococcus aureus TaxID=1280 RepID=UPI003D1A3EA8